MFDREQQSILDIKPSLLTLPAAAPWTNVVAAAATDLGFYWIRNCVCFQKVSLCCMKLGFSCLSKLMQIC
jgi:hypothetical protein